jgi:hypothetical protein
MSSSRFRVGRMALLAALTSLFFVTGCGAFAPAYPKFGETSYRLEGDTAAPDGGAAIHTVIYRVGPNLRVETVLPQYGRAVVVFDQATNAAYVLNPTVQPGAASNTPTVAPNNAPAAAPAASIPSSAAPTPVAPATAAPAATAPNGAMQTATTPARVIGVAVRIADADAPQPLETPWAALGANNAKSVGACEVAGQQGHEWQPSQAPAPGVERTACITADGIVLRVRENSRTLFEATNLQRGPQSASLFGIPQGYQMIDPATVAARVGEASDQLNSVTGSPTTASPPPG